LAVCFLFVLFRPGFSVANERAGYCLSCHIPSELLPIGITQHERVANRLKWRACPGMTRINRAVFLTESSLAELNVLAYQNDYREKPVDRALWDAETQYRLLREKPITSQSVFVEQTGMLRRRLDDLVLTPLARDSKKSRILLVLLIGMGLAAVIVVVVWRITVRRSSSTPKYRR
jgi:hypothetical protein